MNPIKLMTGMSIAAVLCGCVNNQPPLPPPPTLVTPTPLPPPPTLVTPIPGETVSIKATISESAAPLNVKIDAKGKTAKAKTIVEKIKTNLESAMVSDQFLFMDGDADIILSFNVTESQFDKSGNYYVWDAAIPALDIKLKPSSNKLIGKTSVATVRGERVLGENAAIDSVTAKLTPQVIKWVKTNLVPERTGLKAVTLQIQCMNGTRDADDAYIKSLRDSIWTMKGIYYCNITKAGDAHRFWDIRVVYDSVFFATGFTSRVMEEFGGEFKMQKVYR